MSFMKTIYFTILLVALASCNSSTGSKFSSLEETDGGSETVEAALEIVSFTPTDNPVVLTTTSTTTFAVAVNSGAGEVRYAFLLDDTTTLQDSSSPFYQLLGSSLAAGNHTLKVTATNSLSSANRVFNVRKNQPPSALTSSPSFTGNTINCDADTLTMSALTTDADGDTFTQTWMLDGVAITPSTPGTVITNAAGSAQLQYSPSCSVAGFHTLTLRLNDSYETTDLTWTVGVANPAVETIISYFPTSNNITYLSTKVSDLFSVTGSGVGGLTFTWKLDGVTVATSTTGITSNYTLLASAMAVGTHVLSVTLTDSSTTNDPATPVERSWTIYKNQKPRILAVSPSGDVSVNLNSPRALTANVEDALDTFTTTITKGPLDCVPDAATECGLTSVVLPTTTGPFTATFTSGTTFLGANQFTLTVTDSYGESETQTFNVTANYFSNTCNNLAAGEICTLVGLPGLGSGVNLSSNPERVRVSPARMIRDDLGNIFFSDHTSNTVWYYNRSASPVDILNVQVPAQSMYVVAGIGVAGNGGNGQFARKTALNFGGWGGGLAWDSSRKELYVADYSNGKVRKIDPSGRAYIVCGGANLTAQGSLAKDTRCSNPVDLEFDTTNRRLYISQYGDHIIKVVNADDADFNNWKAYLLAGASGSSGFTTGTINVTSFSGATYSTIGGTTRLRGPWGLYLDETDQILYFTEYTSCRVRAIGLPGATSQTVGGQTINALSAASITQPTATSNKCGNLTINSNNLLTANIFNRPMDLVVDKSGASVRGIFVSDNGRNVVSYINNSGASRTLGNQTIADQRVSNVFGNSTTNAPTNPPSGKTSAIDTPFSMFIESGLLYTAIRGSNIIRTLNINTSNGAVANLLGGTGRAGYSGNSALDSILVTLNRPGQLLFKENGGSSSDPIPGNTLYVSDTNNAMIRAINLLTGRVEDFIGTGAVANENLVNTVATATRMRAPKQMAIDQGFFFYNDANANCFTRAYNPFSSDQTIYGTLVNLNKTSPVAGIYNVCNHFIGTTDINTTNLNARMNNPWGIGVDPLTNDMFVSQQSSHCILRVTFAGQIKPFIGDCGTAATAPVLGGVYNDPSMRLNNPTSIVMDPTSGNEGNFFFVDYSNAATAHVKYVNLKNSGGVDFFGGSISIGINNIDTVLASAGSPGHIYAIAAFDDWICYGSGNGTNGNNTVYCRNRQSGTVQNFGIAGIGGIQIETEHEGVSATSGASTVTFSLPQGLTFDSEGNLYVSEAGAHVIRKIKRWY